MDGFMRVGSCLDPVGPCHPWRCLVMTDQRAPLAVPLVSGSTDFEGLLPALWAGVCALDGYLVSDEWWPL